MFSLIFGGAVALVLLLLYASIIIVMIRDVIEGDSTTSSLIKPGMVYVFTTVSGLVSALIVAHLAVSKPGDNPGDGIKAPKGLQTTVNVFVVFYVAVWFISGLAALVFGVMLYDTGGTLKDTGTSWLGLAIAAGYAYFGIQPQGKPERNPSGEETPGQ